MLFELIPFMKEIKNTMNNFLQTNITNFNESLHRLSAQFEEHKNQTAAELAQLQTLFDISVDHYSNLTHQLKDIKDNIEELPVCTCSDESYTCGGTEGWQRVLYLNMTDPTSTCPDGWQLTGYSKRTCGRISSASRTCDSAIFPICGVEYSKICGRIIAYQWGGPEAFWAYHTRKETTIDDAYVAGVSLTHGSPRQHIWTFAAGATEGNPTWDEVCPCDASININVPSFVGEDYFCESGIDESWSYYQHNRLHPDDPLWDGENCRSSSSCCSLHGPPTFVKELTTPTTDDIEARICLTDTSTNDNIAVEIVELYVQ